MFYYVINCQRRVSSLTTFAIKTMQFISVVLSFVIMIIQEHHTFWQRKTRFHVTESHMIAVAAPLRQPSREIEVLGGG